jgi:outer membrane protein OmpA-like peptidoglycan-associated protein
MTGGIAKMRILVVAVFIVGLVFLGGNTVSAIVGNYMDKQVEEVKQAIPAAKVERVGEGEDAKINITFDSVFLFDTAKSELKPSTVSNLDKLVGILQKYPDTNILIEGHTDSIGKESYNMKLSERRAKSVQDYLVQQKIDGNRMTVKWYDGIKPIASNNTEEGRKQNRRVEISITASDKLKLEEKITQKKAVVDETALKIAELQKEIERLKKELEISMAKNEELASMLKKKDGNVAELEAKVRSLNRELGKQVELKAQLEDMRKSAGENRDELGIALRKKAAVIAEKEARISEMEFELKRVKEELSNLESANRELKEKITKPEKTEMTEESGEMMVTKSAPVEMKGYLPAIAVMALAIVGAMIWVSR